MELNICHLYPELLNTYGDIGNINILKFRAGARDIAVNVHSCGIGQDFTPSEYDIVFLGGGQDFEMSIVLEDIKETKSEGIREYIEDGGVLLAICGGYQILGEYYENLEGSRLQALGILPFYTVYDTSRHIGNICVNIDGTLCVGFENHSGRTYLNSLSPLGQVVYGFGNNGEDKTEGAVYKNTICTYLHGPFLSKNPEIADRILNSALERKYEGFALKPLDDSFEEAARAALIKRITN